MSEFHKRKGGKFGVRSQCKECVSKLAKERYANDPDYRDAINERYANDPDYREAKKKRNRERWANYPKSKYRESKNKRWRERYATDPEFRLKHILKSHERRAKERSSSDGSATPEAIRIMRNLQYNQCKYCKCIMNDIYPDPACATIDHVVAINNGGAHSIKNIVIACSRCNSSKGDTLVEIWLAQQGYVLEDDARRPILTWQEQIPDAIFA